MFLSKLRLLQKRRLILGAFFVCVSFSCVQADCGGIDGVSVSKFSDVYVVDGDTLDVEGLGRVRLLNINTPEMNFKTSRAPEPFAIKAAEFVKKKVSAGVAIEHVGRDRYKRVLANVWVREASAHNNWVLLDQMLVVNGLAFQIFESPGPYVQCLMKAEEKARKQGLGVWSQPDYWLNSAKSGFVIWRAPVADVEYSGSMVWLVLDESRRLGVRKALISSDDLMSVKGKSLESRGWAVRKRSSFGAQFLLYPKTKQGVNFGEKNSSRTLD